FGLLAGGLAWFWVTRPVRLLTAQVAASGQDSIIVLWTLLLVALFGLLAGGLAWFWVTRPVRLLTAQVAASGQDSI
ncbi:hypothetical protein CQA86_32480, partial [Klebsiella pneumoniae]